MSVDAEKRTIIYANETTITVTNGDAVMTFRWVTPQYDENNKAIGRIVEKEVVVSMPMGLLVDNANRSLGLVEQVKKITEAKKTEPQESISE